MNRIATLSAGVVLSATVFTAVAPGFAAAEEISNQPVANVADFAQNLEDALAGAVGFQYAIAKDGKLVAHKGVGDARTAKDTQLDMTSTKRFEIASATKTFTAVAILNLLEANSLTPETFVSPYLPAGWSQANGWSSMRFRHLLAHTSGLGQQPQTAQFTPAEQAQWGTLYSGLQFAVSQPVIPGSARNYTNMNFALLRVVLLRLWAMAEPSRGVPAVTPNNSGAWVLKYHNEKLLKPAGIAPTDCLSWDPKPGLTYDLNAPTANGTLQQLGGTNYEACAGHRGLHLSAVDMTRFMTYLRATNLLASSQVDNWMDTAEYGYRPSSNGGALTGAWFKDGDITNNGDVHTCLGKFPGNIEASILVNSQPDAANTLPCTVLTQAYLNAV